MEAIKCDVCNGALEMEAGGRTATCVVCGMRYSVERLQEKLCATQNFEGGINVGNIKISEDAEQLKTLLVKYLDSFDYNNALHIINRILEAAPTDAEANKIYDKLQELRYFEIKNKVLVKYKGTSREVIIPDGVVEISKNAFSVRQDKYGESEEGVNVEKLTIPDTVTTIGDYAFAMCMKLKEIHWGKNIEEIGEGAFKNTAITTLELPDKVKTIGGEAFMWCDKLTTVSLPNGIDEIPRRAFLCSAVSNIEIPNSVKKVCYGAFDNTPLEKIVIPDSVIEIESGAFEGCEKLVSVTFGNTLKTIGEKAFYRTAITEITLPASVTEIGGEKRYYSSDVNGAFARCEKLASVTILNATLEIDEDVVFAGTKYINDKHQRAYELKQKQDAENERRRQEEARQEDLRRKAGRRQQGVCQYCGGTFNGLFTKKCSNCGRVKDY